MEDLKGNLRRPSDSIISIKIRNHAGEPQHKAEFRLNDRSSLIKELSILKDKFGVDCFEVKGKHKKTLIAQQGEQAEEELDNLRSYRERSRGLREPDKDLQEKMKKVV